MSIEVKAQESGSPSFEAYDRVPLDPVYISGGGDSTYQVSQQQDSIRIPKNLKRNVYKPSPVVPKDKDHNQSTDDSILSFNFLYYLIQKYKMQDIVD